MKKKLVVLTEIIAPYRIPVFNALARRPEIDLRVIFLSRTDTSMRQWMVYEDEIQFSYEVLAGWRRRIGRYNVLLNRYVVEALSGAAPDVIVCGGYNYLASWQAMRWAKERHIPFILWSESTVHDIRNKKLVVESLKKTFLRNCDAFVVPGQSALDYLEFMGVSRESIYVARNAVDVELFSALGKRSREQSDRLRTQLGLPERYFLFVGRLVREKGVLDLLDAYSLLSENLREQIGLVFAGDGPMRADLESLAREIYPGLVHFAGFVDRDDLAAYYALAECLVLPTYSDTWGLVVNEAMACALPVICTEVAGCAPDLVRKNGRLVLPGDVNQICEAMREIARDAALRTYMAAESEALIREFSPEACASGIAEATLTVH